MNEQRNNVGGGTMGMANSAPRPLQNAPTTQSPFGAPDASEGTDFYAQQPASASQRGTQYGALEPVTTTNQNNNDVANTMTPSNADDSDLIEKEWVEKAKAIVEKTRRNPFLQSQELNQFKAEYLQKRYGKNVGADEQ
jgi:hypothetical protein